MPFQAIAVRQALPITVTGQASPITAQFSSAVAAGSTLVFVGTAIGTGDAAALLATPSGGGSWFSTTNTRSSGDAAPNVCASLVANVSAGSPQISLPFTVGGSAATSGLNVSGVLLEIEKVPASNVLDTIASPKTGTSSGNATSTSAAATGTLGQTDNLLILCAGGWFGVPQNPASWTSHLTQQNGASGRIGCQVSSLKVTSTATVTGTVSHEATPAASAVLLVIKAAVDTALAYEFEFLASELPSQESGIEALIARNVEPMASGVTYEYYSNLTAESGTKAGDTTTRLLRITSGLPGGVSVSDTLRGSFRKSGSPTKGAVAWIIGTVKSS